MREMLLRFFLRQAPVLFCRNHLLLILLPAQVRNFAESYFSVNFEVAYMRVGLRSLTAKVSGWLKASPLERRVRPEGQKGAPSLEDVRGP